MGGKPRILSTCQPAGSGAGQEGSASRPSSREASGRRWGLRGARPPRAPGPAGLGQAQRRGADRVGQGTRSSDRARHLHSAQLSRESTAAGEQGASPGLAGTPDRWPGAHGTASEDLLLGGELSPRAAFNPVRPQGGEARAGADSLVPPPGGPLAAPRTAHPYPSTAQARLRSGHRSGMSGARPGRPGPWPAGLAPLGPWCGGGARARAGRCPRAHPGRPPRPAARGRGRPGPRRGQDTCGGPAAGSTPAPPPPRHCARRHLHLALHAPPPRARPARVARPRPAAPRRPSSYEYVKRLYCPLPLPRPRGPAADPLGLGLGGEEAEAAGGRRPAEEEGRCRRAGGRARGGVG